jgi:hypothetical protein
MRLAYGPEAPVEDSEVLAALPPVEAPPAARRSEPVTAEQPPARWVRTYINDHRAGAVVGLALTRRCRGENRAAALGETLADIEAEIEADASTLEQVAARLGIRPDPVKLLIARVGELAGRLKLNGRLTGYSPGSRVLELEGLLAGIDAKHSLWRALGRAKSPALREFDFDALADRAVSQRERLRRHHDDAAREMLVLT